MFPLKIYFRAIKLDAGTQAGPFDEPHRTDLLQPMHIRERENKGAKADRSPRRSYASPGLGTDQKNRLMTKAEIRLQQKPPVVRLSAANSYFRHGLLEPALPYGLHCQLENRDRML
jgi:hypothetical protein